MSRHASFTTLCGRLSKLTGRAHADLHVHTTSSDGDFTPSQAVAFARQAGLAALAITDHDTLAAVREAQTAADETNGFEVIAGVEISTAFAGRELHLLGYFVRLDHSELNDRLLAICDSRRQRFHTYLRELAGDGFHIPAERIAFVERSSSSLGRRHIARLLVGAGLARTVPDAFQRVLPTLAGRAPRKELIPIDDAIRLVRTAGGVPSLAHPPSHLTEDDFRTLAAAGLAAVEVDYPWGRSSPVARLRQLALRYGFAVSGGSDCHGADNGRRIGSHGVTQEELDRLRRA